MLSCPPALAGWFNGHSLPDSASGISGISELWMSLFLCMCGLHFSSPPPLERAVLWAKASARGVFRRGLPRVSKGYFWSSLGEKVVRNAALEPSRGECSSASLGCCAGSAAGGGSVREDPVSCRRVLVRSPDSKVLRKHSFYSVGLLLLPGNTLSTFQRFMSFGCSYLSSTDFALQLMGKGHCPQHPYLQISVPACLGRLHCHS